MSSRLRLLLDSVPLNRVDPAVLAAQEDQVLAWQLDIGQELAAENVPLAYVVLVVEGTLRISGRDALGQPSRFAGSMLVSGGDFGAVFPVFRLPPVAPPNPQNCLLFLSASGRAGGRSLKP